MSDKLYIKSLRGPGGMIDLGKGHKLEFDSKGVAFCPKEQEKFWINWEKYGKLILTLDEYIQKEADKRLNEFKDILKKYTDEIPEDKKKALAEMILKELGYTPKKKNKEAGK